MHALVVDDVQDNREVLSRMLQGVGIEVATAHDGRQAIESLRERRPDILFMDVRMPVMDGLSAMRAIREQGVAGRPVCVAISASGLLRKRSEYLEAGFDDAGWSGGSALPASAASKATRLRYSLPEIFCSTLTVLAVYRETKVISVRMTSEINKAIVPR